MTHLIRKSIKNSWPIPRTGSKYIVCPYPGKKNELAMPLAIILRDILKLADTRKEIKELLKKDTVLVDNKIRREEKFPVCIFDTLSIPKIGKFFRMILNAHGKLALESITEKETTLKTCKIVGKKILNKGIQQINCFDSRNILSKEKINVNDSIIFDLKENKIVKILPLKENAEVFVIGGKHKGIKGKIAEIKDHKIKVQIKDHLFETKARNIYLI